MTDPCDRGQLNWSDPSGGRADVCISAAKERIGREMDEIQQIDRSTVSRQQSFLQEALRETDDHHLCPYDVLRALA